MDINDLICCTRLRFSKEQFISRSTLVELLCWSIMIIIAISYLLNPTLYVQNKKYISGETGLPKNTQLSITEKGTIEYKNAE